MRRSPQQTVPHAASASGARFVKTRAEGGLERISLLHRDILSKILCFSERQFLNRQRKLSASAAPGAQALPEPDAVERGTSGGASAVPEVTKNTLVAQDNTEMFAAESKYLELL